MVRKNTHMIVTLKNARVVARNVIIAAGAGGRLIRPSYVWRKMHRPMLCESEVCEAFNELLAERVIRLAQFSLHSVCFELVAGWFLPSEEPEQ